LKAVLLLAIVSTAFGQTPVALHDEVAYLASDQLQGRKTPSPGLDLAADYIADQFRKAGLEPIFQTLPLPKHKSARNVAAILQGTDPVLRDEYVILSAHYDHIGFAFPGANDNASGVASVIEIATALAASPEKPRRSILFLAFAGEEEGLLGSYYYVAHPLVPLKHTVVEINLEQLGRTDEQTGQKLRAFAMTGTSKSNLVRFTNEAVNAEGVAIYHRRDEDDFFNRSDNFPFATKGVVDTTIVVAFDYPDYHKSGDTIDKIDFDNLAVVDRGIMAAVRKLANAADRPTWTHAKPLLP
jgi:aminopeptidase-like protein